MFFFFFFYEDQSVYGYTHFLVFPVSDLAIPSGRQMTCCTHYRLYRSNILCDFPPQKVVRATLNTTVGSLASVFSEEQSDSEQNSSKPRTMPTFVL